MSQTRVQLLKKLLLFLSLFVLTFAFVMEKLTTTSLAISINAFTRDLRADPSYGTYINQVQGDRTHLSTANTINPFSSSLYLNIANATNIYSSLNENVTFDGNNFVKASATAGDKYYRWYRKIGFYDNHYLDLRIVVKGYTIRPSNGADDPITDGNILVRLADSGKNQAVNVVNLTLAYEFYVHNDAIADYADDSVRYNADILNIINSLNTQTPQTNLAVTFAISDIDAYQGVLLPKVSAIYAIDNNNYLKYISLDEGDFIYASTEDNFDINKYRTRICVDYSTGEANSMNVTYSYASRSTNITEMGTDKISVTPTALSALTKSITDSDEVSVHSNTLASPTETFTYNIAQTIPFEGPDFYFKSYTITDSIPAGLTVTNVKVVDTTGASHGKKRFTWSFDAGSRALTISATNEFLASSKFYDKTFIFQVSVKFNTLGDIIPLISSRQGNNIILSNTASSSYTLPGYYYNADDNGAIVLDNNSSIGGTFTSNTVTTAVPLGTISIHKSDIYSNNIPSATFGIYEDPGCQSMITYGPTDIYGNIAAILPANRTYYVREISVSNPEVYIPDATVYTVDATGNSVLDAGETVVVPIINRMYGYVQIVKTDSVTGLPMGDCVFGVYRDVTCYDLVEYLTTTPAGTATSSKLIPGTYFVRELSAPMYYVTDGSVRQVDVADGQVPQVPFANIPYGDIKVAKIDSVTRQPLNGATFGIYTDPNCAGAPVQEITTANDGTATSVKLVPNTPYWVKEISAPQYYVKDETIHPIASLSPGVTTTVQSENIPYGDIKIVKIDSVTRLPLNGATFGIYNNANCSAENLVDTVVTANDGTIVSKKLVPNTPYWVKEISAPQYYVKDETAHLIESLAPGVTTTINSENIPYGQIRIIKRDSVHNEKLLPNAVFNIYENSNLATLAQGNLTTAADGTITSMKLVPNKSYWVKEITPPAYYVEEKEAKEIRVEPGIVVDITIYDIPYGWIKMTKTDSYTHENLAGATFKIYQDSGLRTEEPQNKALTTGADGTVTTDPKIYPNKDYWVKETAVPYGYVLDNDSHIAHVYPDQTTNVPISNKPWTATVEVSKRDKQTGNIVTKVETTFVLYEWSTATNSWVKPTHVLDSNLAGRSYAADGGLIIKQKNSGTHGTYLDTIYYNAKNDGRFKIVEYTRPYGYVNSNWVQEIRITADGQKFTYSNNVTNDQVRGQINFKKNDVEVNYKNSAYGESFAQGDASLQGAIYQLRARENIVSPDDGHVLYAKDAVVNTTSTDANGKITWDNLYLGKYYIVETTASTGYFLDTKQYDVDLDTYYRNNYFTPGDQQTQKFIYKNTTSDDLYANAEQRVLSKEQVKKQGFQLTKLGLDNDSTMSNPLNGAGFKIYLIKDLSKVKNGSIKKDANGNYNAADFLNYDFTNEQTALNFAGNANGSRIPEIFTDASGTLKSPELAYGQYIVIESTTPKDYTVIQPFIVNIVNDSRTPQSMVYPIDREFTARVKIVKRDTTTGRIVLKENAAYRIYDLQKNEYVQQAVSYPNKVIYGTAENPYKTTDQGYLITPDVLGRGDYELREVGAPDGYVIVGKESVPKSVVRFSITSNAVYEVDPDYGTNSIVITVDQKNEPQVGQVTVSKQGEFLSNAQSQENGYQFNYTTRPVTDAKFAIYAKEDIYTQDNQKDENGNRYTIYKKDQLVREVATNGQGKAVFEGLALGKYYIKETVAGNGFVLNTDVKEVELTYEGQEKAVIFRSAEYFNERQKVEINVTKKDAEVGTVLQGAVFGLYNKEVISYTDDSGRIQTIPANQLVAKATSGENGVATFNDENLPLGNYYIKELKAPKGYSTNHQTVDVDCTYIGQDNAKVSRSLDFTNIIIKLRIKIFDYETGAVLEGTEFVLRDEEGNIVGTYVMDSSGYIEVKGLEVGKQYTLEESKERYGYVKDLLFTNNTDDPNELVKEKDANGLVNFTIKDSEQPQTVTVQNISKVGQIEVEKTGEVLVGYEQDENENYTFKYENQRIDTATFEVTAIEDIIHPDGVQGVIVESGTVIGEGNTVNGVIIFSKFSDELIQTKPEVVKSMLNRGLPLGTYKIRETKAPYGYILNTEEKEIEILPGKEQKQVIHMNSQFTNERQKVFIQVKKRDAEDRNVLQGATFGLYTKEAINYTDSSGNEQSIPADQLILKATSGEDGVAIFDNDECLPLAQYYIKEIQAPKGYSTNHGIINVNCSYIGQDNERIEYNLDFTNVIIKLRIKISDFETGATLEGTELILRDEEGNIIGTYTVDPNNEIIVKGLEVGKRYTLEESKERYGYVKDLFFSNDTGDPNELVKGKDPSGLVTFTIKDSEEIQSVSVQNISKVGQVEIEKIGDVLVGVERNEHGNVEFQYEKQRIDKAMFEIIAKEDIIHPDGVQGLIVEKGTKIAEGHTENGILTFTKFDDKLIETQPDIVQLLLNRGLPIGVYEIKEILAPEGYYYRPYEQIRTVKIESHKNLDQIEKQSITIENPMQNTNIGKPNPSISVEKKAEKEVYKAGEEIVYSIAVTNTGNTILRDVEVEETMINGEFDEAEGASKQSNNIIIIKQLEKGETKILTYRFIAPENVKGKIDNKVTATGTPIQVLTDTEGEKFEETLDKVTDDAEEEVYVETVIEKTVNKKMYKPGDWIEYTLTVLNPNDTAMENVIITDEKVTVGSIISTSKEDVTVEEDGSILIGTIEARGKIVIVYKYQIPEDYAESTITNTAELTATIENEPITPSEDTTTVEVKKSAIEVIKETDKDIYRRGEIINYNIVVTNTGETLLTDVIVKENLLNGKFLDKSGIEILDDQTVKIDKLKIGESVLLTYQYTVPEDALIGEKIYNNVTATGTGIIENPEDPENPTKEEVSDETDKEVTVREEDPIVEKPYSSISVEKVADKEVYRIGEEVVYTITVTNTGDTLLRNVEVKETMINGEFDEAEGIVKQDNNTVIIEQLEKGETKILIYRYEVPEETVGKLDNKVVATGTPVSTVTNPDGTEKEEVYDPVTDDAEEEVYVETVIEKTADKKMYKPGDMIEYTLTVLNPNDVAIENATIKDEKALRGSLLRTSKEGITIAEDGVISIGTMEPREKIEIVYLYEIPEDYAEETITNEAEFNGIIEGEPVTPSQDSTTVEVMKSGIEVVKEANKKYYKKGEMIVYTITVTNTGETVLRDVIVQEKLLNGRFEEQDGINLIDDQTVSIDELLIGESKSLTYYYMIPMDKVIGEKIHNSVTATGTGIVENPDDPDNPKEEKPSDENDNEVIIQDDHPENADLGVYKIDSETEEPIEGAIFGLYTAEPILGVDESVLVEKDVLIQRATTDKDGYAKFTANLPIGKFYILELKPIAGYIKNTERIDIDSTDSSTGNEYRVTLQAINKKTVINIEKVEKTDDLLTRIPIVGSTLQILDNNNVIYEWNTDGNPYTIKGLETEKEYTLHEVEPARGYVTTPDIKFVINTDGSLTIDDAYTMEGLEIPTIIMQDDYTRVRVDIVDKETKEPVEGVVVQIVDKKTGEVVDEFVTDGNPHIVEKLPIGDYEIVEKDFPRDKGYVHFEPQDLTVEDTPELQKKVIEKDFTKLDVTLVDESTKDILPGGKLELRDENGDVVATIDDTGVTWYKERLPAGEYTLVEVEIPEGYETAEDIKFTLKDIPDLQHVVMENRRLPFDLKVEKYASQVLINGARVAGTDYNNLGGLVKVEVNAKKLNTQKVQVTYTIRVTNSGKVAGAVGKITDTLPAGLTFDASKNNAYWKAEGGNVITTTEFAKKVLKPGEYFEVQIVLDWQQNSFNFGDKQNIVTIGDFLNNPGFEDSDSTNNSAKSNVLFSIRTGLEIVLTQQIVAIVLLALMIIGLLAIVEIKILHKKK